VALRKKIYGSIAELQGDIDRWVQSYNEDRPHQGRWCFGKTPLQTFLDAKVSRRKNSLPPDQQTGETDSSPGAVPQIKFRLLHLSSRRTLRPTPDHNYKPSPRLRWKLQSILPPGVNVPDTC
jgi:hypothetical protein